MKQFESGKYCLQFLQLTVVHRVYAPIQVYLYVPNENAYDQKSIVCAVAMIPRLYTVDGLDLKI